MHRRRFIALLGVAITAVRAFGAQEKTMRVIGFLNSSSPGPNAVWLPAFHQGLGETGYVEGQNVAIKYRWAEGHYDRLPRIGRRPRRA
jgi:putative ABC transport system substrate-binding protein